MSKLLVGDKDTPANWYPRKNDEIVARVAGMMVKMKVMFSDGRGGLRVTIVGLQDLPPVPEDKQGEEGQAMLTFMLILVVVGFILCIAAAIILGVQGVDNDPLGGSLLLCGISKILSL